MAQSGKCEWHSLENVNACVSQALKPVLPPKPEILAPPGSSEDADEADGDADMAHGAAANGGSAEAHWTDEVVDMVRLGFSQKQCLQHLACVDSCAQHLHMLL